MCPHRRAGACKTHADNSPILDDGTCVFAAERDIVAMHIRTQHAMNICHMGVIMQAMPIPYWCVHGNHHSALPVSLPPRKISACAFAVVDELDEQSLIRKTKSRMRAKPRVTQHKYHKEKVHTECSVFTRKRALGGMSRNVAERSRPLCPNVKANQNLRYSCLNFIHVKICYSVGVSMTCIRA